MIIKITVKELVEESIDKPTLELRDIITNKLEEYGFDLNAVQIYFDKVNQEYIFKQ